MLKMGDRRMQKISVRKKMFLFRRDPLKWRYRVFHPDMSISISAE
jgi:hypothetical protein